LRPRPPNSDGARTLPSSDTTNPTSRAAAVADEIVELAGDVRWFALGQNGLDLVAELALTVGDEIRGPASTGRRCPGRAGSAVVEGQLLIAQRSHRRQASTMLGRKTAIMNTRASLFIGLRLLQLPPFNLSSSVGVDMPRCWTDPGL